MLRCEEAVRCQSCECVVPRRDNEIMKDLCDKCVEQAMKDAQLIRDRLTYFTVTYGHSPTFVHEFGEFVLRSTSE